MPKRPFGSEKTLPRRLQNLEVERKNGVTSSTQSFGTEAATT